MGSSDFSLTFESYKQAFADLAAQSEHVLARIMLNIQGLWGVWGTHNRKMLAWPLDHSFGLGCEHEVIEKL